MPVEDGRCEECGYNYETVTAPDAIVAIRSFARRYRAPLTRFLDDEDPDSLLRARPIAGTWSALEYACHMRDVLPLYQERIERALREDAPHITQMDPDALARERDYNGADAALVAEQLATNAENLAAVLDRVHGDDWNRTVVRDGRERSILWMARHVVHEGSHHLLDIGRVLRAARGR